MEPIIRVKKLSLHRGENFSLSIEDLNLYPQQIYALTGANGAGKSTLLKTLALLITPDQGTVSIAAAMGGDLVQLRQQVTLVEQSPYLLNGSVSDNLAFGLKLRGIRGKEQQQRITSTLEMVGLAGLEQRKAKHLSGGEVQRVALARALVLQPQVLLLDEPTANIDSKSLQAFEALLSRLPDYGVTVVLSTHDLTQPARLGAQLIRIENGRLLDNLQRLTKHRNCKPTEKKQWLKPLRVQGL